MRILRNLKTPEGRKIWEIIEEAAASAPKWAKKAIERAIKEKRERE